MSCKVPQTQPLASSLTLAPPILFLAPVPSSSRPKMLHCGQGHLLLCLHCFSSTWWSGLFLPAAFSKVYIVNCTSFSLSLLIWLYFIYDIHFIFLRCRHDIYLFGFSLLYPVCPDSDWHSTLQKFIGSVEHYDISYLLTFWLHLPSNSVFHILSESSI